MNLITHYKSVLDGTFKSSPRPRERIKYVVLHHTAGESLKGAVDTLIDRGLGYHYIIDREGTVHAYVHPEALTNHASDHNARSIGISFIGGSFKPEGAANEAQIAAVIELLRDLQHKYGQTLQYITGHKHIDVYKKGKIDPQWKGETNGVINQNIDTQNMESIAKRSGLIFKKDPLK